MPDKMKINVERARRRGRPLRARSSGFGAFFEAALRYQHLLDGAAENFTDYLDRLYAAGSAENARATPALSQRQLMRLRGSHDIPSFATLQRLAGAFPALGDFDDSQPEQHRFKDELWAPRLGWAAVRENWKLLPPGSDVTICMGLVPSWALERLTGPIVRDLGAAISDPERDLTFYFVFPKRPEQVDDAFFGAGVNRERSVEDTLEDVRLSIAKDLLRTGADSQLMRSRIRRRVRAYETLPSAEAMYFWSRCPRALMISNLFRAGANAAEEFAAAYELTQVPYPASFVNRFQQPLPPPLTAAGWGYIMPQSHERLRALFSWLLKHKQVVEAKTTAR